MYRKTLLVIIFITFSVSILCYAETKETNPHLDIDLIAKAACEGIGKVYQSAKGKKGTPIIVLEEKHNSRVIQIQHAITLVRLYDKYGLKHIGLEGYLKDEPPINTEWFIKAAKGDNKAKIRTAIQLLKEGEISNGEFMKLAYDDISLHPIESSSEHTKFDNEAAGGLISYLYAIAQRSMRQEHYDKIEYLQKELASLSGVEKNKKSKELLDYIFSVDPWVSEKARKLLSPDAVNTMTAEQYVSHLEEIKKYGDKNAHSLASEDRTAMENYIKFWRNRVKANRTMADVTGQIADKKNTSITAMIIGRLHTDGICKILAEANRPYAVISPLMLKEELSTDLTPEMFEKKYEKKSVYTSGFMQTLNAILPSSANHMKPKTVLNEPWLQGKAELYLFTDKIAGGILGPPSPPGGGKPPYGFSDENFKGSWVFIDPKRISVINDDKNKGRAVLFPVVLNWKDSKKRSELWVKAGLSLSDVSSQERESVEAMLQKALQELKSENGIKDKIEDDKGRVQITTRTIAAIAKDMKTAHGCVLGAI